MHHGLPYDSIQGQGQGHEFLKAFKRSRPLVPHGTKFWDMPVNYRQTDIQTLWS